MCEIDITGVNRVMLLHELWNLQIVASFFAHRPDMAPTFNDKEAIVAIQRGYIDYFCGRCIKSDLTKNFVSPRMYDRDAGDGAFLKAVQIVKWGNVVPPITPSSFFQGVNVFPPIPLIK